MSHEVAEMLLSLIAQITIKGDDPELLAKATLIIQARSELEQVLSQD